MLGFQGGVSIPLVKGGVKAPPAKRQCRAGPKAGARRGFTFCPKKWPEVRIVTYGLPKSLARFFVRTWRHFACFSDPHGRFYMAKRQGYMASASQTAFRAILPLRSQAI